MKESPQKQSELFEASWFNQKIITNDCQLTLPKTAKEVQTQINKKVG